MHKAIINYLTLVLLLATLSSASALTLRRDGHLVDLESRSVPQAIDARATNARLSFYNGDGKIGSCGVPVSNTGFTVALNPSQWSNGAHCFQLIIIEYNGKAVQAQITDQCPGCPFNGLALTPGLFQFFAPLSDGVISGSWFTQNGTSI
ncbi:hypothetical protein CPB84DRAFT_1965724 [Gymnopilus junonius]|uniref:RlpA-like protein double-psi beta-barrel domain-containing protein n=1 Tax=Gymnopilus junonius TaxID=109634 RepID=A0A9P5NBU7_GYMJU|nr:hypothetical protein CPB84DRAFT_1965724 [Gymnopilus junonius]